MRTYVRALEQPDPRRRRAAPPAGLSRRGRGAALRCARGARHALLRGPRPLGAQPCARRARGCRSAGPSTRTGGAVTRASTALPGPHTRTSASTPAAISSGRSWSRSTRPRSCASELARPSWSGEHVALGTNTDPYQWVEGRYRLMEGIWEALRDAAGGAGNPCSVLTKSPLLLRDLPLMLRDRTADHDQREPLDPHARRARVARDRAAHPQPARPSGGGGGAQPRGHPHGRADRTADARDQRRAPPAGAAAAAARSTPARASIGGVALHLRGEVQGRLHGVAARRSAPTSWSATRSSTAAAPTRPARSASAWPGWYARGVPAAQPRGGPASPPRREMHPSSHRHYRRACFDATQLDRVWRLTGDYPPPDRGPRPARRTFTVSRQHGLSGVQPSRCTGAAARGRPSS